MFVVRCTGTGEAVIIDAANEHELLARGVARHRRPARAHHARALGPHPGRHRDARRRDRRRDRRRRRRDAAGLRLRDRRRRSDRRGRPPLPHDPQSRPHPRFHLVPARGPPAALHRRHPLPRRARQHRDARGRTSPQIIESIDRRLFTLAPDCSCCPATASTPPSAPSARTSRSGSTAGSRSRDAAHSDSTERRPESPFDTGWH